MAFQPRTGNSGNRAPQSSQKPKFVYKERSIESVKERAERQGARFDSPFKNEFDTFRARVGDNTIRILPPTWDNHDHYAYQLWVHRYIGPDNSTYLCPWKMLKKKCPVCEAEKTSRAAGELDEAKQLAPGEQFACWIINRDEDESSPPIIYPMSWTMDRDIAALSIDKRKGKLLLIDHPHKGYDITFKRQGTGVKTKYFGTAIDREATPISDDGDKQEEILQFIGENPIPDTLKFYPYDYLLNVISGGTEERDVELDEQEEDNSNPIIAEEETEAEAENEEEEAHSSMRRPQQRVTRQPVRTQPKEEESEEEQEVHKRPIQRKPVAARRSIENEEMEEENQDHDPETGEVFDEEDEEQAPPPPRRGVAPRQNRMR